MVGGGVGAFIGAVHRIAARIDGQIEIVCGAFSNIPEDSIKTGEELYLDPSRAYVDYYEMFEKEAALPADKRMDFVTIVTPNFLHFEPAKLALENGYHVVCEKPMTFTTDEARELAELVNKTGLEFALTHTYTGYPLVKEARKMVADGKIGEVRKVVVEYPQGWLTKRIEAQGQPQASWRTDPKKSGKAGAIGDIGTHAANLAEYITGLKITELLADLTTFVEGRMLDDDGNLLIRLENGAKGVLHCSQVSAGEENALNIRIYGTTGGLEWHQMEPNTLLVKHISEPTQIYRAGGDRAYLSDVAQHNTRIPAGHPEGYLEAFANIYHNFAQVLQARLRNEKASEYSHDFPSVQDGVRGMHFIDKVVESSEKGGVWITL